MAYLCDPELRRQVANIGEDPDSLPKTYAKLINASIAGKPADMTVCMHLCRGNFAGAWIAEGGYEPVAELLFNEIGVDGYFLEYDSDRAGGFAPLRFLPKGKTAVLGLVTTKSPKMETKDELKRRIDEASRYVPLEQLALSPQCGFSSGIGGTDHDGRERDREAEARSRDGAARFGERRDLVRGFAQPHFVVVKRGAAERGDRVGASQRVDAAAVGISRVGP